MAAKEGNEMSAISWIVCVVLHAVLTIIKLSVYSLYQNLSFLTLGVQLKVTARHSFVLEEMVHCCILTTERKS